MAGFSKYSDKPAYPHRIIILILSDIHLFYELSGRKNEDNISADSTESGKFRLIIFPERLFIWKC